MNLTGTIEKPLCGLGLGAGEKKQQVGALACELRQVHRRGGGSLAPGGGQLVGTGDCADKRASCPFKDIT